MMKIDLLNGGEVVSSVEVADLSGYVQFPPVTEGEDLHATHVRVDGEVIPLDRAFHCGGPILPRLTLY
jgi:hypothetical protein